jgi:hypothetical protein
VVGVLYDKPKPGYVEEYQKIINRFRAVDEEKLGEAVVSG